MNEQINEQVVEFPAWDGCKFIVTQDVGGSDSCVFADVQGLGQRIVCSMSTFDRRLNIRVAIMVAKALQSYWGVESSR